MSALSATATRRQCLHALALPAGLALAGCVGGPHATPDAGAVRVAVVGGLQLCGVWPALADIATQALGLPIDTVAHAPKEGVGAAFARGDAHMLLIHANDEAMSLEAAGLAAAARVWGWNEHVIAGPADDPARVRSAAHGVQAMQRIAASASPFIALRDPGSYGVVQRLWRRGGVRPDARWLRADTGPHPQAVLQLAARERAYVVVGHIPLHFGKMPGAGDIRLLLKGDPMMRKPYVLLLPGPRHAASAAERERTQRLGEYLLSAAGQNALAQANAQAGASAQSPWIFGRDSVPAMWNPENGS